MNYNIFFEKHVLWMGIQSLRSKYGENVIDAYYDLFTTDQLTHFDSTPNSLYNKKAPPFLSLDVNEKQAVYDYFINIYKITELPKQIKVICNDLVGLDSCRHFIKIDWNNVFALNKNA